MGDTHTYKGHKYAKWRDQIIRYYTVYQVLSSDFLFAWPEIRQYKHSLNPDMILSASEELAYPVPHCPVVIFPGILVVRIELLQMFTLTFDNSYFSNKSLFLPNWLLTN